MRSRVCLALFGVVFAMWLAVGGTYVFAVGGRRFFGLLLLTCGAVSVLLAPFLAEGHCVVRAYLGNAPVRLSDARTKAAAVIALGLVAVVFGLYSFIEV